MTDKGMGDELRRLLNACQISPSYASKASVKLRDALWDNRHAIVTTLALPVPVAGETRLEKEEAAHLRTIDQRDEAEQCIGKIYFKIIGRSPEWSNHFGYDDALQEIEEAIFILRDATPEATIELRNGATAERVKAIRSLYVRPDNSAVVIDALDESTKTAAEMRTLLVAAYAGKTGWKSKVNSALHCLASLERLISAARLSTYRLGKERG